MSQGLYSGVSGLAIGVGLYKGAQGLWGGASGLITLGGGQTLALDFLAGAPLDPRITFTRASTATFVGSNGLVQTAAVNTPRFDYSPTTLQPLGLLIEEQRTNIILDSEQLDTANWTKTASTVTANAVASPNGTINADKLVENTATATHSINTLTLTPSGTAQAFSFYAKQAERSKLSFGGGGFAGQGFTAIFDLANGTMASNTGSKATITAVGNGWYRCVVAFTPSNGIQMVLTLVDAAGNTSYTGNGTSGLYIWGVQIEAGAFVTSYIPTTSTSVTRSADLASMTGSNFSSWYNQSEGTFVVAADTVSPTTGHLYSADDVTSNNRIFSYGTAGGTATGAITAGGVSNYLQSLGSVTASVPFKTATAYATNSANTSVNGVVGTTDTSVAVPTVDRLRLGTNTGGIYLNGHLRALTYYPTRLTDATLPSLTA